MCIGAADEMHREPSTSKRRKMGWAFLFEWTNTSRSTSQSAWPRATEEEHEKKKRSCVAGMGEDLAAGARLFDASFGKRLYLACSCGCTSEL